MIGYICIVDFNRQKLALYKRQLTVDKAQTYLVMPISRKSLESELAVKEKKPMRLVAPMSYILTDRS